MFPTFRQTPPAPMTAEQAHRDMMDHLHITALRPCADGFNAQAPNVHNIDGTEVTDSANGG